MKEAAGEANMTVVTIILVGLILSIGTVIIKGLMKGIQTKACEQEGGTWVNDECQY